MVLGKALHYRQGAVSDVLYVRVPAHVKQEADRICAERRVSMTVLVNRALETYLADHFGWKCPERVGLP